MTQDLIKGLEAFKRDQYSDAGEHLMPQLVKEGQSPEYFIISCIDSRSNPSTIFRTRPGSFFAHKAMGAIIRPYKQGTALAAALQFALSYNKVDKIIVLGHTKCGAIQALVDNLDDPEISSFVNVTKNALIQAKSCCNEHDKIIARTEQEVVLESVENLKKYPSVAQALQEKRVKIFPWIFNMEEGTLLEYNTNNKTFEIISTTEPIKEDQEQHA